MLLRQRRQAAGGGEEEEEHTGDISSSSTSLRASPTSSLATSRSGNTNPPTRINEEEEERRGRRRSASQDIEEEEGSSSIGRQKRYLVNGEKKNSTQEQEDEEEVKTKMEHLFLKEEERNSLAVSSTKTSRNRHDAEGEIEVKDRGGVSPWRERKERERRKDEDDNEEEEDECVDSSLRTSHIALKSFFESFFFYLYMSFVPGYLTSISGSIYPFSLWLVETRSAVALWLALASWSCLISRGDAVTDPASFVVGVCTAKAWREELEKKRKERRLAERKKVEMVSMLSIDDEEEEGGEGRRLSSVSIGVFLRVCFASLMGACVSGYFLRLFYPSSSFLASLSPLPIEVHRSLSSSSSLSFSSSFFSSFFPFFSSSFQVSLLEWLRWLVQALCSIYAFTRHAFLGVCTAGISMILNPGGGDHEYQERLIQSDLFKNLFGPVSFANSLLFPSSSASSSFSSSSFSSSSSSPDYLTELVNSFRNETESEKGRLLMSSLLVGEEEEIKKRIRELFFLQGREVEEGDFLLLLWSSRMIDMSLLEFFFGILNYMSIALASILQLAGETYHFKVHHVFLSTLNACCFFYFFGIPFCRPFGGPMLNAGYAALVTSYRLDLIGFLIFVSVDLFSAYISARYLVRPSFLSSSSYPSFSAVERERRRKERKEEKETGDLQDDRDDGDVCEEKERRGLFSRFFLGKKRQKVEDEKNKKKRSLKKTE